MARETLITPEGLEKLKEELEYLETDKRREVADRIKAAREFGDIMENSEYDDAKNEQAMLEQRIASLQDRLRRAAVIDNRSLDTETVGVGGCTETVIRGVDGYLVVYGTTDGAALSVSARAGANLGLLHLEARDAAIRLGHLLAG